MNEKSQTKNLANLAAHPMVQDLPDDERKVLLSVATEHHFRKGQVIMRESDGSRSIFLIVTGEVRVFHRSPTGREVTIANLIAGDLVGEVGFLSGEPRSASVEAKVPSTLYELSYDTLGQHLPQLHRFVFSLAQTLARRLRNLNLKVSHLVFFDVFDRIVQVLQELSQNQSSSKQDIIDPRPTHDELASIAGTTREMVTRALKVLQLEGHIVIDGKTLKINSLPDQNEND